MENFENKMKEKKMTAPEIRVALAAAESGGRNLYARPLLGPLGITDTTWRRVINVRLRATYIQVRTPSGWWRATYETEFDTR